MSGPLPPCLDPRTADLVADEVRRRLGWPRAPDDRLLDALIAVFAHYAGQLGDRLNSAPARQLEAFTDLLRPDRFAAVPARTVLTFTPVVRPGAPASARLVAAGTQVVGPPAAGASEPVVFETVTPLALSTARIERAFFADAGVRAWGDATALCAADAGATVERLQPVRRAVHLALPASAFAPAPATLHLQFEIDGDARPADDVIARWSLRTGDGEQVVVPECDGTGGLARSGEVVFRDLPAWAGTSFASRTALWLSCSVECDPTPDSDPASVGSAWLRSARFVVRRDLPARPVDGVAFGSTALDPSRDFFPFGERPRFGDTCLFRSDAFALPGAQISVDVRMTNPSDATEPTAIPGVATLHEPKLQWDVWTGRGWASPARWRDETKGFTRNGLVRLVLPPDAAPTSIAGQAGGFLRARLARGDYALDPKPVGPTTPGREFAALIPPEQRPPAIARVEVIGSVETAPGTPLAVAVERDLELAVTDWPAPAGVRVRSPDAAEPAALYVGLRIDEATTVGERLQVVVERSDPPAPDGAPRPLRWQRRDANGWVDAPVDLLPAPGTRMQAFVVGPMTEAGTDAHRWPRSTVDPRLRWLRLLRADDASAAPAIVRVLVNAVGAAQQLTSRDEVLGSSSGRPGQVFTLLRKPVLGDPLLEVLEPERLSSAARRALIDDVGADAVRVVPAVGRLPEEIWVRWRTVDDLSASGPLSRDYLLDRQAGSVRFGDGRHGRIPPPGPNNLVVRRYRSGGGAAGNVPAGSLKQLRTTIPYVESVKQPSAATGGQDAESAAGSRASATAWLRHRGRATSPDDYEDLACRATPDVARARCLPGRDVDADPSAARDAPGCVSVAILPRDPVTAAPVPTPELLARVRSFLGERSAAPARIVLCAPVYLRVDVDVELLPDTSIDGDLVAAACEDRLSRFLHPVAGGPSGTGWAFGHRPHVSQIRTALSDLPGLLEVRQLRHRVVEEVPGSSALAHRLIRAGRVVVTLAH